MSILHLLGFIVRNIPTKEDKENYICFFSDIAILRSTKFPSSELEVAALSTLRKINSDI